MSNLVPHNPIPDVDAALDALARRYRQAGGFGIEALNMVGGQAENLLERLPAPVRSRLDTATAQALRAAFDVAHLSRGGRIPDGTGWQNTLVTGAMGAAGGLGGLPTALAELPVTVTVLLRAIQGIAASHGFDPADPAVRAASVQVFAAAGPLARDDGADLGFVATRVTLTGPALNGLIARVAPRLAAALGQKLAAQTVPVLGAVAGAATNMAYTRYYQQIAHVQFGLMNLSRDSNIPLEELNERLRRRLERRIPLRS
ncbi:EcsC family protein [Actibacterium sp. XHP0104]|uniref:EcsC family protein n=1 Tax=Actibacterium sp. XHP0104 TaxID=2984335 RepID=UPI0021E94CD1|nr:EcsC family protein [Actibacterium sp. XHP0104]MCV2880559.1 EcsC family protein [Actibacterium sp. XHP0104]